jgi:hypothetical protein
MQFAGEDFSVRGYKDSVTGDIGWMSVWLLSLLLVSLWFALLFDMYYMCQVYGIDTQCYYGNYPISGSPFKNEWFFFCHWWIFIAWFGFLLMNKDWLRNWFRDPARLADAQYIWVKKCNAPQVLITNPGMAVRFIRNVKKILADASGGEKRGSVGGGGDVVTETVPVLTECLHDGTKLRFVIFQYRLYFLSDNSIDKPGSVHHFSSIPAFFSRSRSIAQTRFRSSHERYREFDPV